LKRDVARLFIVNPVIDATDAALHRPGGTGDLDPIISTDCREMKWIDAHTISFPPVGKGQKK